MATPEPARRELPPTAPALPIVALPDIELLPRAGDPMAGPAKGQTVAGPVQQPSRRWPWAAAAVVGALAATFWGVSAGVIDLGLADLLGIGPKDYVELAMPALPATAPESAAGTTPDRVTSRPGGRSPATSAPSSSLPAAEPSPVTPAAASPSAPAHPDTASAPAAVAAPPGAAPAPPPPAPPDTPAAPAAAPESLEKDPATTAPDSPVTRARRDVGRLLLRAEAAENSGNLNDALALYREVLQLEPKNGIASRGVTRIRVDYLLRRAESQILAGDYEGALNDINTAAADDPKNPRAAELREAIAQGKKAPARKPGGQ
jgi:hypothetical protein